MAPVIIFIIMTTIIMVIMRFIREVMSRPVPVCEGNVVDCIAVACCAPILGKLVV